MYKYRFLHDSSILFITKGCIRGHLRLKVDAALQKVRMLNLILQTLDAVDHIALSDLDFPRFHLDHVPQNIFGIQFLKDKT